MRALSLSLALTALLVSAPTDGLAQTDLSGDWVIMINSEPGEPEHSERRRQPLVN